MSYWDKYYIVGDGRKKQAAEPPRKRRRAWKYWLFFAFLTFCLGAGLGLAEDQEFEAVVDRVVVGINAGVAGDQPSQHIWKRAIKTYNITYTDHFLCRMDCRSISRQEVWTSLQNASAIQEYVQDNDRYGSRMGEIKYTVLGFSSNQRPIKTVFAVNIQKRLVTFITVMDNTQSKQEDPCGTERCDSRER